MPPAVSSDTAVALVSQKKHLILKGVPVETISVIKNDGFPFSPIFEIEFSAVFNGDGAYRISLGCGVAEPGLAGRRIPFLRPILISTSYSSLSVWASSESSNWRARMYRGLEYKQRSSDLIRHQRRGAPDTLLLDLIFMSSFLTGIQETLEVSEGPPLQRLIQP
jgi:hypothetical protein